jgi:hypothetical protein
MEKVGDEDASCPLVENGFIPDIFANGIAHVEEIGGECVRLTFYVEQVNLAGKRERLIVCKLIRPISSLNINPNRLVELSGASVSAKKIRADHH